VRPLGLGNGVFDSYVIYFSVIVPALSLGVKVGEPPVIVRIVPWVGKASFGCWGS
jgi:hypothetical protein